MKKNWFALDDTDCKTESDIYNKYHNKNFIKRLARYKVYIDRARWYLVLVQFLMIVIMFINNQGFKLELWHYFLIIIGVLLLLVVAGYVDRATGLIKAEQQFYADENPFLQDMMRKIK